MSAPRLLIVGHGRMGRLVEALAGAYGFEVAGVLDAAANPGASGLVAGRWRGVDVAIEFTRADAVAQNVVALAGAGVNVVVGTTGWRADEAGVRAAVDTAGIGAVVAANFSLGANMVAALASHAGRVFAPHPSYGAWIHELHHAAKRDAPSGTALTLEAALRGGGYGGPIDIASTRAGSIPGTHTIGFDGPAETVTLEHVVRDRATFAHGALAAARWVIGRKGWFTMADVLGL